MGILKNLFMKNLKNELPFNILCLKTFPICSIMYVCMCMHMTGFSMFTYCAYIHMYVYHKWYILYLT